MQIKKREYLKSVISNGKAYLLWSKWTQEKVVKASNETINKTYDAYKLRGLNGKGETGKSLGTHVINLYYTGISLVIKIWDAKNCSKILRMIQSLKIRWQT